MLKVFEIKFGKVFRIGGVDC